MTATPEQIASAWRAFRRDKMGRLGPGPGFVEAINAAMSLTADRASCQARIEELERAHLCGCPEIGTYDGQVILAAPDWLRHKWPNGIGIDVCLALEIQSLWRSGIQTSGHCCGHGRANPYIGVFPEFIGAMKALGYHVQHNPSRPNAEDSFWPKTKFTVSAAKPKVVAWGARAAEAIRAEFGLLPTSET